MIESCGRSSCSIWRFVEISQTHREAAMPFRPIKSTLWSSERQKQLTSGEMDCFGLMSGRKNVYFTYDSELVSRLSSKKTIKLLAQ